MNAHVRMGLLALGFGAVIMHGTILYTNLWSHATLNLALTNAVSLFAWVIVMLFLLTALVRPIINLGIIIMPVAGLTLLIEWLWPGQQLFHPKTSALLFTHVIIAILAYGLLSLGAVQSLLLLLQERHLHKKQPGGFIRALPPLETMESLMVQMIVLGFVLLTFTAVSGIFFSEQLFGRAFELSHHTVLSVLGWLVFALFLFGRWRFGWRGRTAIRWVLGGVGLLALAYFGTKFVMEVLLQR